MLFLLWGLIFRALQMDPTFWGYGQPSAEKEDDSSYDDHPELSGYQTLPEQDSKDDHDITPVTSPTTATAAEAHGFIRTSGPSRTSQQYLSQPESRSSGTTAPNLTNNSSAPEVPATASTLAGSQHGKIEGMKPNARNILQGGYPLLRP
jgi:hypothetical protein